MATFHISHLGHKFPDTTPYSPHPTALTCEYVTPLKPHLGLPFKVISKAPVDIHWFSIMLLRKKTIMQAYTWKGTKTHRDLSMSATPAAVHGCLRTPSVIAQGTLPSTEPSLSSFYMDCAPWLPQNSTKPAPNPPNSQPSAHLWSQHGQLQRGWQ